MSALQTVCAAIFAFATAMLSGMGVGSGGLFVVYLTLVAGLERYTSQGINLWFFTAASFSSLFIHAKSRTINLPLVGYLSFCACTGCILGSLAAGSAKTTLLKYVFAVFSMLTGAYALFRKNRR